MTSSQSVRTKAPAGTASSASHPAQRASPKDSQTTWLLVTYPGTGPCFALMASDGRITECPPVARWARGQETAKVVSYYLRRGIKVEEQVS